MPRRNRSVRTAGRRRISAEPVSGDRGHFHGDPAASRTARSRCRLFDAVPGGQPSNSTSSPAFDSPRRWWARTTRTFASARQFASTGRSALGAPMPVFALKEPRGHDDEGPGGHRCGVHHRFRRHESRRAVRHHWRPRRPSTSSTRCGIARDEIDGLCGSWPSAAVLQSVLGIPEGHLVRQSDDSDRGPRRDGRRGGARRPVRGRAGLPRRLSRGVEHRIGSERSLSSGSPHPACSDPHPGPETMAAAVGYTGWASRYMYEYGVTREDFGLVAINSRSHAVGNPAAAMREPMTMDDYLSATMIREPLCRYDMDVAVDGADAFIVTTDRACQGPGVATGVDQCGCSRAGPAQRGRPDGEPATARPAGGHRHVESQERLLDR